MKIKIHRGTHQIGGIATEIRSDLGTRIIIDMGEEISLDDNFVPKQLHISGVTDTDGKCEAVLFTHYHQDHIGQLKNLRQDIPIYMGALAKEIAIASKRASQYGRTFSVEKRIEDAIPYTPGKTFKIGDISITPFSIDHSACDSYMFLIEADDKKLLYTGDFRLHGFRGKAIPKILDKLIGKVEVLITEGTTFSREDKEPMTEYDLQKKLEEYIQNYKYVYVLCAATNLERICALSKATTKGRYFICDKYQYDLLQILQKHWGKYSNFYSDLKATVYGTNLQKNLKKCGFVMTVRCNKMFENIIRQFDPRKSIILYSMWDGYRTKDGSKIPEFLELTGKWKTLHTSGHASHNAVKLLADKTDPAMIIPIHTNTPEVLKDICPRKNIVILNDGEEFTVKREDNKCMTYDLVSLVDLTDEQCNLVIKALPPYIKYEHLSKDAIKKYVNSSFEFAICKTLATIINPANMSVEEINSLVDAHHKQRQEGHASILLFIEDEYTEEQIEDANCLNEYGTHFDDFPDNVWTRMINMIDAAHTICYDGMERMEERGFEGPWRVLDLVTTGDDPIESDLIAFNTAILENGQIINPQTVYVKPCRSIPQDVTKKTGITDDMVKDGMDFKEAAQFIFDLNPLYPNLITYFVARDKKINETGENFPIPAPFILSKVKRDVPFLKFLFHMGGKEFDMPYIAAADLAAIPLGYTLFEELAISKHYAVMELDEYRYAPQLNDVMPLTLSALCALAQTSFDELQKRYDLKKVGDIKNLY